MHYELISSASPLSVTLSEMPCDTLKIALARVPFRMKMKKMKTREWFVKQEMPTSLRQMESSLVQITKIGTQLLVDEKPNANRY